MDCTKVMVDFSAVGDTFPLHIVSKELSIQPTEAYEKGNSVPKRSEHVTRKETCWSISTGYQESLCVEDQLNQILDILQNKTAKLIELKEKYNLFYKFFIVIQVENGQFPALHLDGGIIEFSNVIKAELDFDMYYFS